MADLPAPATVDTALVAGLVPLAERTVAMADAAHSPSTRRAYDRAWSAFERWTAARGLASIPAAPETLAMYLTERAETVKVSTLEQELAAIVEAHRKADLPSPTENRGLQLVWKGIRRTYGKPKVGKSPVGVVDLARMVAELGDSPAGVRDRAMLLLGFAGALRRSELVAIDVEDLAPNPDGFALMIRRSKSDGEGEGQRIGIPNGRRPETCPVLAVRAWLQLADIKAGPVFRSVDRHGNIGNERLGDRAVAEVVKRAALSVGLDPKALGGHSLRSGLVTEAVRAGVSERAIMAQTRHKSLITLRGYIRLGSLFLDNPAATLL